jgi:hypothetical protein
MVVVIILPITPLVVVGQQVCLALEEQVQILLIIQATPVKVALAGVVVVVTLATQEVVV